ncbi:hypothetical protein BC629DRAFT_1474868 [Irpex lacteus]|nr:hypothetical protein BC629DRAFT_1474868 [Irpex lacteus]
MVWCEWRGTLCVTVVSLMLNGIIFALQASEINPFHHLVTPQSILMQSSFLPQATS